MRQRNPIFHMLFEKYIDSTGLTQERRAEQGELCGRGYGLRGGVMSEELGVMGKPAAVFPAGLVELASHGTGLYSGRGDAAKYLRQNLRGTPSVPPS